MAATFTRQSRLLLVDDNADFREMLVRMFRQEHWFVAEASTGSEAITQLDHLRFDVALLDLNLPDMTGLELLSQLKERQPELEALMLTAYASIDNAIEAMRRGAYDYLTKPVKMSELNVHLQKALEKALLARRERQWVDHLEFESPRYRLIGTSPGIQRVCQLIEKVASTNATVLVRGSSGTGKELVARALHHNSSRRQRPLVTINCASLQESLLESELFGHEKGSFTGAQQAKKGLIEVAEGGTLFIDEVAEMSPGLQAKLLRVLEDGHFRRVGSTQEHHADVRLIAATNKPLEEELKAGRFREDLYHRLNVITITLPSLKERREDIPELIKHFLNTRQVGGARYQIDAEAMQALTSYSWPGNIRELANVIERAQILAENQTITLDDLPETLNFLPPQPESKPTPGTPLTLRELERRHVQSALQQAHGNKMQAAKTLAISRRALYRLIEKHHLDSPVTCDK